MILLRSQSISYLTLSVLSGLRWVYTECDR